MFMSHGSDYMQRNQKIFERLVNIIEKQLIDGLNSLRMKTLLPGEIDSEASDQVAERLSKQKSSKMRK